MCNQQLKKITESLKKRSVVYREKYLSRLKEIKSHQLSTHSIEPSNAAHVLAAIDTDRRTIMRQKSSFTLGIISSYNEMVSAHAPYAHYPDKIKSFSAELGHSAVFIGGVPAICDGVVQGYQGMELSLMSRDIIAMSTAIPLSCSTADRVVLLGTCDKIVPGMLIGALSRGHIPACFLPSGPMATGISNSEKSKARQDFHNGKITTEQLLDTECKCYHSEGTCSFYGTANTNQVMLESLGLQPVDSGLSKACDGKSEVIKEVVEGILSESALPLYELITEESIINACVVWLATGGSTNHTLHLVAIARAAGIDLCWEDIDKLSAIVPLLAKVYPNGFADVNQFHDAGGVSAVMAELLRAGLLHGNAPCYNGETISVQVFSAERPVTDRNIIATTEQPFDFVGGIKLLKGNLGQGIMKTSAVAESKRIVKAPARVFDSQQAVYDAYQNDELWQDVVVVVKNQGAVANGMPELHKLIPLLGNIYDKGYQVALITDGRLSGASGKVPAVVHVTPEAQKGGSIGQIKDGELVEVDGISGLLNNVEQTAESTEMRGSKSWADRELFDVLRLALDHPSNGAMSWATPQ
ncbi:dihydroxy-acid dehydratase [Vibrio sp. JC009]|uniref:dihydroxy-acid dehydratase domain-containing protein n=1 Tax=Vibrio sp. JC009 TaxID=2912314 RepID=UPI0023AF9F29|nr:dihydroxy-acid dehydratase [Vibrio sp. JC009]WED24234.1 dihydroxy-acid dehydratase [Vibrio sp. JC009]